MISDVSMRADKYSQNTAELQQLIKEQLNATDLSKYIGEEINQVIWDIFNKIADEEYIKEKGGKRAGKLTKPYSEIITDLSQLTYEMLTEETKRRFLYYKKQPIKNKRLSGSKKNNQPIEIKLQKGSDSLVLYMKYEDYIWEEDKEANEEEEKLKILNFLYSYIGQGDPIFDSCLSEVIWNHDIKEFFYGKNYGRKLKGLLGEVLGLYYLRIVLKDTRPYRGGTAIWSANTKIGGKDPHEDLLFLSAVQETYGIQVKNTSLDAFSKVRGSRQNGYIDFTNQNFFTFMNSISYGGGELNLPSMETFRDIYTAEAFNDVYDPKFSSVRAGIEVLAARADKVLSLFADTLMFMQTETVVNQIDPGNIVYFIGGTTIVMASEILIKIYKELDNLIASNERNFRIFPSFTANTSKKDKTYSSYRNNRSFMSDNDFQNGAEVKGTLKLTSSFLFTEDIIGLVL